VAQEWRLFLLWIGWREEPKVVQAWDDHGLYIAIDFPTGETAIINLTRTERRRLREFDRKHSRKRTAPRTIVARTPPQEK